MFEPSARAQLHAPCRLCAQASEPSARAQLHAPSFQLAARLCIYLNILSLSADVASCEDVKQAS
eukprot:5174767-Pleurochrysis_carterae.AAC.4